MHTIKTVSVIGLGYIGLPTAAMFASRGKRVIGVDVSERVVSTINSGKAHIEEGALDELVARCVQNGMLRATRVCEAADAFIIAVPTPAGHDEHRTPDVGYVMQAARSIAPVLERGNLVVLESTSPVGTTRAMAKLLAELRPDLSFPFQTGESSDIRIAYCPERIIPGQMLRELVENDRIVGGMTPACSSLAIEMYHAFVKGVCHPCDDRSAEMVKLTENAFRDVNIAFANELSLICDELSLDAWKVIEMANRHPRVSILGPGPGVGGHCIAVDPWFIVAQSPERARLIKTARQVNDGKPEFVLQKVRAAAASRPGAKIACFGLTYKPDVDDFRESPALQIAAALHSEFPGAVMCVDPFREALRHAHDAPELQFVEAEDAYRDADILVMLVPHQTFKALPAPVDRTVVDTVGLWR